MRLSGTRASTGKTTRPAAAAAAKSGAVCSLIIETRRRLSSLLPTHDAWPGLRPGIGWWWWWWGVGGFQVSIHSLSPSACLLPPLSPAAGLCSLQRRGREGGREGAEPGRCETGERSLTPPPPPPPLGWRSTLVSGGGMTVGPSPLVFAPPFLSPGDGERRGTIFRSFFFTGKMSKPLADFSSFFFSTHFLRAVGVFFLFFLWRRPQLKDAGLAAAAGWRSRDAREPRVSASVRAGSNKLSAAGSHQMIQSEAWSAARDGGRGRGGVQGRGGVTEVNKKRE